MFFICICISLVADRWGGLRDKDVSSFVGTNWIRKDIAVDSKNKLDRYTS